MQRYRTDLARESRELAGNDLQGVSQSKEQHGPLLVERIVIETPEAADRLDKPQGRYITIDADNLSDREPEVFTALSERIAEELSNLLDGIPEQADMMVIGLGNRFGHARCARPGNGRPDLCDASHPDQRAGTGAAGNAGGFGDGARRAGNDGHGDRGGG